MFKINIPIISSELQNYLSSYFFSNKRSNLDDIIHFLSEDNELDETKFIEMVKSVKEKFLLESVSEDFK